MVSDSGKNIQTSMGKGERIITYSDQTVEQFEQLREILKNFNQNLLQLQTWETKTRIRTKVTQGPVRELWEETSQAPRMPAMPNGSQLGEKSQGCHLSQAGSGGHSKGDGQGSHTLPGLTQ